MSVNKISPSFVKNKDLKKIILITGFIAGTLDIAAAFLTNLNINPLSILRYIASGILGAEAFTGGLLTAFLGLIFHFFIAYTWTVIYFLFYPFLNKFSKNIFVNAIFYGIFIWFVMNLIVLPLSNVPEPNPDIVDIIKGIIILIFMIGLPAAFFSHKHYSAKNNNYFM